MFKLLTWSDIHTGVTERARIRREREELLRELQGRKLDPLAVVFRRRMAVSFPYAHCRAAQSSTRRFGGRSFFVGSVRVK